LQPLGAKAAKLELRVWAIEVHPHNARAWRDGPRVWDVRRGLRRWRHAGAKLASLRAAARSARSE